MARDRNFLGIPLLHLICWGNLPKEKVPKRRGESILPMFLPLPNDLEVSWIFIILLKTA